MHSDIINILKQRREILKVSQETLAELAGIGLRTIKEIESGRGNPTLKTLQKIADILGMEINIQIKKMQPKS